MSRVVRDAGWRRSSRVGAEPVLSGVAAGACSYIRNLNPHITVLYCTLQHISFRLQYCTECTCTMYWVLYMYELLLFRPAVCFAGGVAALSPFSLFYMCRSNRFPTISTRSQTDTTATQTDTPVKQQ